MDFGHLSGLWSSPVCPLGFFMTDWIVVYFRHDVALWRARHLKSWVWSGEWPWQTIMIRIFSNYCNSGLLNHVNTSHQKPKHPRTCLCSMSIFLLCWREESWGGRALLNYFRRHKYRLSIHAGMVPVPPLIHKSALFRVPSTINIDKCIIVAILLTVLS